MSAERSWGQLDFGSRDKAALPHRDAGLPAGRPLLARGNGRSYGDVCVAAKGGIEIDTRRLDHFLSFDPETGRLACEAGVMLSDLIELFLPQGWYPPVVPGTRFVTVGGAIANDIHGKNHHAMGSFGRHVTRFELLRSDGSRHLCSETENPDLFAATIGGLGLTGLITWAEIALRPVPGAAMRVESSGFQGVNEYLERDRESREDFEYRVAWIDCMAGGDAFGRGIFSRANHAEGGAASRPHSRLGIPLTPPFSCVNRWTSRAFNAAYYRRQIAKAGAASVPQDSFFFPLDGLTDWNRLYGPSGFYQHQSVVPEDNAVDAMTELIRAVVDSGLGSPLVVLKSFGDLSSPGLLSFPRPGLTLAVDIRNTGGRTTALLDRMDAIVVAAGGAIYPAKDAHMSDATFRSGFPGLEAFSEWIDPGFGSAFWHRVMGNDRG